MSVLKLFIVIIAVAITAGCANKERLYENIYQGTKTRDEVRSVSEDPSQIPPKQPGSYQQYKSERQEVLKGKKDETTVTGTEVTTTAPDETENK